MSATLTPWTIVNSRHTETMSKASAIAGYGALIGAVIGALVVLWGWRMMR